jgi:glycosyltransferase involved in cell wall biosynthesis
MKQRVLYLCPRAPWAQNAGALIRNYWMIRALSRRFDVDLVTAAEPDVPMPADFAAAVDQYACFPRSDAARGTLGSIMRAASPNETTLTAGWTNAALREYVFERLGRHPYTAIQVDLPMRAALPRRDGIPIVYNAHNCEYELLRRRAKTEPPHVSAALALDALRVRRVESHLVARSALVTACADSDVRDFERFCRGSAAKMVVIANGVDVERYAPVRAVPAEPRTVLITGNMDWRPNVQGLRWFIAEALPRLRALAPDATVRVAGRMNAEFERELRTAAIEPIPNPPSMEEHLGHAAVVAAPIVASSGTRLRILEAWAAGRPVVTTKAGAFGLAYEDGRELIVRDNPLRFAEALARVLGNRGIAEELVRHATTQVSGYDWRSIGDDLLEAYDRIAPPAGRRLKSVKGEFAVAARA